MPLTKNPLTICGPSGNLRAGYTLVELGIVIALVAIVLGLVVEIRRIRLGSGRMIASIQLSSDGNRLAAGFSDGSAAEWDTKTGALLGSVAAAEYYDSQYPVVVCADGRMAARILLDLPKTGGFARALQISSLETGREILRRPMSAIVPGGMAFSPDGSRLAIAGAFDVFVVDPHSAVADDIAIVPRNASYVPIPRPWRAMAFDPIDKNLFHLSATGQFTKWNLDTAPTVARQPSQTLVANGHVAKRSTPAKYHARPQKPEGGNYEVRMMAFSPDGKRLATASIDIFSSSPQWIVELVDADAFATVKSAAASSNPVGIGFIDSGNALAVLSDDHLEIWDAETLKVQQVLIKPGSAGFNFPLQCMSAAPDSNSLAVASEHSVYLLEGNQRRTIVDISPSHLHVYLMAAALPVVIAGWIWLRYCGRRPRPVGVNQS